MRLAALPANELSAEQSINMPSSLAMAAALDHEVATASRLGGGPICSEHGATRS
jgi:hypothetical protein